MKKVKYIFLLISFAGILWAQEYLIDSFKAYSNDKTATLEWHSINESNIAYYEIERSPSSQPLTFKFIGNQKANGYSSSYTYRDDNVFLKDNNTNIPQSKSSYTYRLKIVNKDFTSVYSDKVVTVTMNLSGIRKTWGMIKEMFK